MFSMSVTDLALLFAVLFNSDRSSLAELAQPDCQTASFANAGMPALSVLRMMVDASHLVISTTQKGMIWNVVLAQVADDTTCPRIVRTIPRQAGVTVSVSLSSFAKCLGKVP